MGHKRQRRSDPHAPRKRAKWSRDEENKLLVLLNLNVEKYRANCKHSQEEVSRKLAASFKTRTSDQISGKLLSMRDRSKDSHARITLQDIYKFGTSCMNLDDGRKDEVQAALIAAKDEERRRLIASPRKLRSTPRSLDIGSSLVASNRVRSGYSGTPTSGVQPQELNVPYGSDLKEDPSKKASVRTTTPESLLVQRRSRRSLLSNGRLEISVVDTEASFESGPSIDTCREGKPDDSPSLAAIPSSRETFRSSCEIELQKSSVHGYEDSEQTISDCPYETFQELINDKLYFRQKWMASEREREKLSEKIRRLELQNGRENMQIDALNNQILDLKHQSKIHQFLQPFLELEKQYKSPPTLGDIKQSLATMKSGLGYLSAMDEFSYPQGNFLDSGSKPLRNLLRRVLGDFQKSAPPVETNSRFKRQVPAGDMVRSLTGAAICEWVFQPEFRCSAMMSTSILEELKHHLSAVCGEVVLRNLLFASHKSLVKDDRFKEGFLDPAASKLADRLLAELRIFVKANKRDRRLSQVQSRLKSVFLSALEVKVNAIIGKDLFETIWPAHEATFESDSMTTESGLNDWGIIKHQPKKVKLCLVPGLCVYSYDRKMNDYYGFTKGDEGNLGKPDIVFRAVVAIEE